MLTATLDRFIEQQRRLAQQARDSRTGSEAVQRVYRMAAEWGINADDIVNPSNRKRIIAWLKEEQTGLGLFFRAKYMFGYDLLEEDPHLDVCRFWYRPELDRVQLEPRGVYKTSIAIAFATGCILDNPNEAIAFGSYTMDRASEVGEEVRGLLDSPVVTHFYGIQKGRPWRGDRLVTAKRTRPRKEGNLQVFGPDAPITGGHYDRIIWDDPHDAGTLSAGMKKKVRDTYSELQVIRRKWALVHIIATRWAWDDLAGILFDEWGIDPKPKPGELVSEVTGERWAVRVAIAETGNYAKLYFPGEHDEKNLRHLRRAMGRDLYAGQMLQDPRAGGARVFEKSWLDNRYDLQQLATEYRRGLRPLFVTVGVDPNRSKGEASHWTGITAWGMDPDGTAWLLAGRRDKYAKPSERYRAVIDVCRQVLLLLGKLPDRIVWEGSGGQDQDAEGFHHELKRLGHEYSRIETWWPKSGSSENPGSKEQRIERMQPDAEYGCLQLPMNGDIRFWCDFDNAERDLADLMLKAFVQYPDWADGYDLLDSAQLGLLDCPVPQWPSRSVTPYGLNDGWSEPRARRGGRPDIRTAWRR